MKKFFAVTFGVLVLAGVAGGAYWKFFRSPDAPVQDAPKTATIARGDIEIQIEATGAVESNLDVDIKCKASGTIQRLPFDKSDLVPAYVAGVNEDKALLVTLDPIDEQHHVQQVEAQVDADNARVKQAEANLAIAAEALRVGRLEAKASIDSATATEALAARTYQRIKELFDRGVGTRDEVDNIETAWHVAQANLELAKNKKEQLQGLDLTVRLRESDKALAEANLKNSKVTLEDALQRRKDTNIYSPIDGVITARNVQVGQIVASGISTVGGGTTLMTVSDMSHMFVVAAVDESDIGQLRLAGKLGQEVTITSDSYLGQRFRGKVVQVTPSGTSDSNVVTFPVKIEILGEGKNHLWPKMNTNVKILVQRKSGVLLIPNSAIRYDQQGTYVDTLDSHSGAAASQPARRHVKLGLNDGQQAEVLDGLSEGDRVIIGSSQTKWSSAGRGGIRMH